MLAKLTGDADRTVYSHSFNTPGQGRINFRDASAAQRTYQRGDESGNDAGKRRPEQYVTGWGVYQLTMDDGLYANLKAYFNKTEIQLNDDGTGFEDDLTVEEITGEFLAIFAATTGADASNCEIAVVVIHEQLEETARDELADALMAHGGISGAFDEHATLSSGLVLATDFLNMTDAEVPGIYGTNDMQNGNTTGSDVYDLVQTANGADFLTGVSPRHCYLLNSTSGVGDWHRTHNGTIITAINADASFSGDAFGNSQLNSQYGILLYFSSNTMYFYLDNGTAGNRRFVSHGYTGGNWYWVVLQIDETADVMRISINDFNFVETALSGTPKSDVDASADWYFGVDATDPTGTTYPYAGEQAYFSMWDRVLNERELRMAVNEMITYTKNNNGIILPDFPG